MTKKINDRKSLQSNQFRPERNNCRRAVQFEITLGTSSKLHETLLEIDWVNSSYFKEHTQHYTRYLPYLTRLNLLKCQRLYYIKGNHQLSYTLAKFNKIFITTITKKPNKYQPKKKSMKHDFNKRKFETLFGSYPGAVKKCLLLNTYLERKNNIKYCDIIYWTLRVLRKLEEFPKTLWKHPQE